MKSKIKKTALTLGLLGTATIGLVTLQAAPEANDVMKHQSKVREVVQTVTRNLLNFRNEMPLSDEQKTRIRSIMENHRAEIRTQMATAVAARRNFSTVAKADPDSEATLAAVDDIAAAARGRALLSAKIRSEIHPTLTEEQQKFAEKAMDEIQVAVDQVVSGL